MHLLRFLVSLLLLIFPQRTALANEFEKNEQVRSVLRQNGDDTRTPRSIQHFSYFPNQEMQKAYHDFVVSRGYRIDDEHGEGTGRFAWALIFSKVQAPVAIDEETSLLSDKAALFQGEYDGWETDVIRQD